MKQVVIINQSLKMSKGKIARVCMGLGYSLYSPGIFNKITWQIKGRIGVALKYDDKYFGNLLEYLKEKNIKYVEHVDVGKTQVPKGSLCGIAFWLDGDDEMIDNLKLL